MRPLILVGGGGHCKSVIEAAESAGYAIRGILDLPDLLGTKILGYEVVGSDDDMARYVDECDFVVTLGSISSTTLRAKLHDKIAAVGGRLATIVASTAHVSRHAVVGEGSVVLHHATVNAAAVIGKGCIINTGANIEHDARVGDFTHVSTCAVVNGDCAVGANCFVGSRVVMYNGTSIVDRCLIGAGSVVGKSLKLPGVYIGNPLRFVKDL